MTWADDPSLTFTPEEFASPLEAMVAGWTMAATRQFVEEAFMSAHGRFISATEFEVEMDGDVVRIRIETIRHAEHGEQYNADLDDAIAAMADGPPLRSKNPEESHG
jgi:hypothetical protein